MSKDLAGHEEKLTLRDRSGSFKVDSQIFTFLAT